MKTPTVSIIIPTYNRAHLVGRAVNSVIQQTYKDFELIVVDDGSTDNTEQIIKNFDDSRIIYLKHKKTLGGSTARNTGIKNAKGRYLAFLDSDDEWLPDKLKKQLIIIQNSELDPGLVYTGVKFVGLKGDIKRESVPQYRGKILQYLLEKNILSGMGSTALIKKECFEKTGGFDEKLPSYQDIDLWIRMARNYAFDYIPEPLAIIKLHEHQITKDWNAKLKGRRLLFDKIYSDLQKDKKKLAKHHYNTGILYVRSKSVHLAREYLIKSIKASPSFKAIIVIILSLLGVEGYRIVCKIKYRIKSVFNKVSGKGYFVFLERKRSASYNKKDYKY